LCRSGGVGSKTFLPTTLLGKGMERMSRAPGALGVLVSRSKGQLGHRGNKSVRANIGGGSKEKELQGRCRGNSRRKKAGKRLFVEQ